MPIKLCCAQKIELCERKVFKMTYTQKVELLYTLVRDTAKATPQSYQETEKIVHAGLEQAKKIRIMAWEED